LQNFHGKNVGQLLLDTAKNIGQTSGVTQFGLECGKKIIEHYDFILWICSFDKHDFIMGTDKKPI
jgi:hypothetical protein